MKPNDRVTYKGKQQGFSNTLGYHKSLFPGRCGVIKSITGRTAVVEFNYNGEPLDFVIPLADLMRDAYTADAPAAEVPRPGFWRTLLEYLHV
jgi:hypothetical protein